MCASIDNASSRFTDQCRNRPIFFCLTKVELSMWRQRNFRNGLSTEAMNMKNFVICAYIYIQAGKEVRPNID